jgi:hypothetical protein
MTVYRSGPEFPRMDVRPLDLNDGLSDARQIAAWKTDTLAKVAASVRLDLVGDRRSSERADRRARTDERTSPRGVHFGLVTPTGDDELSKRREERRRRHGGSAASAFKDAYLGA